jgi:hypothetical protein
MPNGNIYGSIIGFDFVWIGLLGVFRKSLVKPKATQLFAVGDYFLAIGN